MSCMKLMFMQMETKIIQFINIIEIWFQLLTNQSQHLRDQMIFFTLQLVMPLNQVIKHSQ